MIRVALILQVIFGLIVGPNGCCCAGHRIGALIQSVVAPESVTDSCCESQGQEQSVPSCCSHCKVGSDPDVSHKHPRTSVAYPACCQKTDSCLCIATIRPSIHRVQIDTELSLLTDSTTTVAWRVSELEKEIASARLSSGMSLRGCDQPSRACAVQYQRWNC